MGYIDALVEAGAVVHEFKEFGSYQGDWVALVTVKGETGWVEGSYGSCSGCDSFESEFGWSDRDCNQHSYRHNDACLGCQAAAKTYDARLADFGKTYLDCIQSTEQFVKTHTTRDWGDDEEMVTWVRKMALA
jgi:hypothetical protein